MVVAAIAVLNYAVATGARPCIVSAGPLAPEVPDGWRNDPRAVDIYDARRAAAQMKLEDAGFELVRQTSGVVDFLDDAQVRGPLFAEVEAIARSVSGATRVVAFDWTRRTKRPPTPENTAVGAPVLRVHNDFTPRSAAETLRHVLPDESGAAAAGRRYAIVSVWRPIVGPVSAWPLALADARTVADADLIPIERRYPQGVGETGFVAYRPAHRWYTFPRMQLDEAVVFKLFDSAAGVARWTPHSAFRDPATPADAPPRESIEVRALVLY